MLCHGPCRLPDSSGPICQQTEGCVCVCARARACVCAGVLLCTSWSSGLRNIFQRNGCKSLSVLGFERDVPGFSRGSQFPHKTPFLPPSSSSHPSIPLLFGLYGVRFDWIAPHPFRTSLFKTNENKNKILLCLFKPRHTHNLGMKRLCQEIKRRERLTVL